MDWSGCDLVERNPLKLGGVPILKGTRLQADAIVENYESGSPIEEIEENFGVPVPIITKVLEYAADQQGLASFELLQKVIREDESDSEV